MNIKEHIEAEHYEKDVVGRAHVRCRNGTVAVILSTAVPGGRCIGGFTMPHGIVAQWCPDGTFRGHDGQAIPDLDLLPPLPRMVPVLRFLVKCSQGEWGPFVDFDEARRIWEERKESDGSIQIVSLRGEYDERWL